MEEKHRREVRALRELQADLRWRLDALERRINLLTVASEPVGGGSQPSFPTARARAERRLFGTITPPYFLAALHRLSQGRFPINSGGMPWCLVPFLLSYPGRSCEPLRCRWDSTGPISHRA